MSLMLVNLASEGTRTPDLLITSQLLYQLSYTSYIIILINIYLKCNIYFKNIEVNLLIEKMEFFINLIIDCIILYFTK